MGVCVCVCVSEDGVEKEKEKEREFRDPMRRGTSRSKSFTVFQFAHRLLRFLDRHETTLIHRSQI